jgi:Arc/MetJ-type ribon-helix-helix transcriptional regulator
MQRGFTDFVATQIIPNHPGHEASWYAREYLNLVDKSDLVAQDPIQSLANTLSKQVQTGREKRVRRERIRGIFRYFPVSELSTLDAPEDIIVQFSLSTQNLEDVDNLIAVGKFTNRNDAVKWLVVEGIKSNRDYLDRAAQIKAQIEQLKRRI